LIQEEVTRISLTRDEIFTLVGTKTGKLFVLTTASLKLKFYYQVLSEKNESIEDIESTLND